MVRAWWFALVFALGVAQAAPLRLDFGERTDWGAWVAAQPTVLKVAPCAAAPSIDGRPGDAAWDSAARVSFPRSSATYPVTTVAVCFDSERLYVLADCPEQAGRERSAQDRERDGPVWSDDCIEMWLSVGGGTEVFQFVVNAAGSIYDAHADDAEGFNPDWEHAVTTTDEGWTLEIALPAAALGLQAWRPTLNFNIGRKGPGLGDRPGPRWWWTWAGRTPRATAISSCLIARAPSSSGSGQVGPAPTSLRPARVAPCSPGPSCAWRCPGAARPTP